MNVLILTPAPKGSTRGNRITANRWMWILKTLGHRVAVSDSYENQPCDLMIALHAGRSADAVKQFKIDQPNKPVVVAITGTDIHIHMKRSRKVAQCLALADRIVMLEPEAAKLLKPAFRKRVDVIFQSAVPVSPRPKKLTRFFEVSIVGHLRDVKDPFLIAEAVKLLPHESRIKVVHLGKALEPKMKPKAERETAANRRYRWLGPVSHRESQKRMARSHLTVLTSKVEGAPSAISEALVNDVPILATRIPATIGMLGANHPGLFQIGDTKRLAELLFESEQSPKFYRQLIGAGKQRKPLFKPSAELKNWRELMKGIEQGT